MDEEFQRFANQNNQSLLYFLSAHQILFLQRGLKPTIFKQLQINYQGDAVQHFYRV